MHQLIHMQTVDYLTMALLTQIMQVHLGHLLLLIRLEMMCSTFPVQAARVTR